MSVNNPKMNCGDSKLCFDCSFSSRHGVSTVSSPAQFTVNAKGRCDYYDGPSHESVKINIQRLNFGPKLQRPTENIQL